MLAPHVPHTAHASSQPQDAPSQEWQLVSLPPARTSAALDQITASQASALLFRKTSSTWADLWEPLWGRLSFS
jgi:hypothetical protein